MYRYFTTPSDRRIIAALFVLLVLIAQLFSRKLSGEQPISSNGVTVSPTGVVGGVHDQKVAGEVVRVTRVIDGDTIEVEGGKRVRYIGIDTPELTGDLARRCFGKEAREKNRELVEGKTVRMVKDISETDRFGRLLRYVYVGEVFVNETLIREGYAVSATFLPDVTQQELLREAENEAREQNRGLWQRCKFQ